MSAVRRSARIRPSTRNRDKFCSVRRRSRSTKPDWEPRASGWRSFGPIAFAGPAIALMFIDDSHGLHERIANGGPDETETSPFQVFAHRVAMGGRGGNVAQ